MYFYFKKILKEWLNVYTKICLKDTHWREFVAMKEYNVTNIQQ